MRVAIVGAGFAGLMNAMVLAGRGFTVDVYEEHMRVGYPRHCTGLVSASVVDMIGSPARNATVAGYTRVVFESGDNRIEVLSRVVKLDRVRLEEAMLEEAESRGARVILGERVRELRPYEGGVILRSVRIWRTYDMVILAEGLAGRLRKILGRAWNPLTSYGVNLEYTGCDPGTSDAIVVAEERGAWFSWRVPLDRAMLVGGLGSRPGDVERSVLRQAQSHGCTGWPDRYGGRVIHGPPMPPRLAVHGRIVVVGDAAALTKPLSGGGLQPNALLASLAYEELGRSGDPIEAYRRAYARVYRLLRKQYALARALLVGGLLWPAVRSVAPSLRGRALELDYDMHDLALRTVLKALGARLLLAGARLILARPRALLWLPRMMLELVIS